MKVQLVWRVERGAAWNYRRLGKLLAADGDLYRNGDHGHGLVHALPTGRMRRIGRGAQLAPVIVDRIRMRIEKESKPVSELPTAAHPQHIDEAVDSIRKRYEVVGRPKPPKGGLIKEIRGLTGAIDRRFGSDAERLAYEFLVGQSPPDDDGELDLPSLAYHRQRWFQFKGTVWTPLSDDDLYVRVTRRAQQLTNGEIAITERLIRDGITNLKGLCSQFDSAIQTPLRLDTDGTCKPTKMVACQNGLLRLRTGANRPKPPKLRPFTRRHFSTVQLGFEYDPKAKCPHWEQALQEILTPTGELDRRIDVLQEFFGWTLFPGGERLESFLVLFGDGANGKSQLLAVLRQLLGDGNSCSLSLEQLGSDFRLSEIEGKLANISGDMNRVDAFAEGVLKQLVSNEPSHSRLPSLRTPHQCRRSH